MDDHLQTHDLGEIFARHGKVKAPKLRKINLDLPETMLDKIDKIAGQIGIARQPLLKMWIHDKIRMEMR